VSIVRLQLAGLTTGELGDTDRLVDDRIVNARSMSVVLADGLHGVMVLNLMSLSLNDRLDLFDHMLVDVLVNARGVDLSRMGLLPDLSRVVVLALGAVFASDILGDVLTALAVYTRRLVLVTGVLVLLVKHRLHLLVNIDLVAGPVDEGSHFVVGMTVDLLVSDGVLNFTGVGASDAVIDGVFAWSAFRKCCGSSVRIAACQVGLVGLVLGCAAIAAAQGVNDFIYDTHGVDWMELRKVWKINSE